MSNIFTSFSQISTLTDTTVFPVVENGLTRRATGQDLKDFIGTVVGLTGATGAAGVDGATGAAGAAGVDGATGPAGAGIAAGGQIGQILAKKSLDDYDTEWINLDGSTGTVGGTVSIQDEGIEITATATTINFVGEGVEVTSSGTTVTVEITATPLEAATTATIGGLIIGHGLYATTGTAVLNVEYSSNSETPPADPREGDFWWDTVGGRGYIRYIGLWVEYSPQIQPAPGPTGPIGPEGIQGATGPQGDPGGATGPQGSTGATGIGATGVTGPEGIQGATGPQGATGAGATGAQGPIGATGLIGATGSPGVFGGITIEYRFDTTIIDQDPGTGKLAFNNATLSSATILFIDDQNVGGVDVQSFLRTIDDSTSPLKGHFRLSNKTNSSDFAIFTITAISEESGYFKVTCAYIDGAIAFSEDEEVIITFARTGDIGSQGATGETGATGLTGPDGATGSGATGAQGITGETGATGAIGETGATGPEGAQGDSGAVGADSTVPGPIGATGPIGDTGAQGDTGATGAEGVTGATGPIGVTGATGATPSFNSVAEHILPATDLTYDLGSTSSQWRSLYVGTSTIYIGGSALSVIGGNLSVNGSAVGSPLTTSKFGYAGAITTVTQTSSRGQSVTMNKLSGDIELFSASVAAGGLNYFQMFNNTISSSDVIVFQVTTYNPGIYLVGGNVASDGTANIWLKNVDDFATSTESPTIRFIVVKA